MATHILAITYQPKIEGVKNGAIRQTIRPLSKVPRKVGDKLLLHGWSGKPYRSPWNWRMEGQIFSALRIDCTDYGVLDGGFPESWRQKWVSWQVDRIAELDGISPPTGLQLKHVLESYHGKFTDKPVQMQVIRW
jgi:hypothetical protein